MGSMCQHGILGRVLNDKCPENPEYSKLCPYIDELPDNSHFFLYNQNSPFKKIGHCADNKEDFVNIVKDSLSSPTYIYLHTKEALKTIYEQLFTFEVKVYRLTQYNDLDDFIASYFSSEFNSFMNSKQQKNTLKVGTINIIQYILFVISILIIIVLLSLKKTRERLCVFHIISILFVVIVLITNAFVTGYLSSVVNRYQNRVIWLIPLIAFCLLSPFVFNLKALAINRVKSLKIN
jgi:hypothetical protein